MDKEEILLASRQEHKFQDVYELEINKRIPVWCAIVPAALACILVFVELIILPDPGNIYGYGLMIYCTTAAVSVYRAIRLKQRTVIFFAVLQIFLVFMGLWNYIRFLMEQVHG